MQAYRRIREYSRRRLINAHPTKFRWTARLIRTLYRLPLPGIVRGRIGILAKFLVPDRLYEMVTLQPDGIRMRLRLGDSIQAQIFYWGHSEPHLIDWFRSQVKPKSIVLDVGAHCGQYALIASQAKPDVQVYAFEPDEENARDLQFNIEENQLENIHVLQVAVADRVGRCRLYSDDRHFGFTNYSLAPGEEFFTGQTREVDVVSLDRVIAPTQQPVCLIKLDIEGAELLALRGAEAILRRDHPSLMLEVDARWTQNLGYEPRSVLAYLADLGYDCYWIDHRAQPHAIMSAEADVGADWVAVPSEK